MTRIALRAALIACIAAAALAPATAAGSQSSDPARTEMMRIDSLKQIYLDCERRAVMGSLDTGDIMQCSVAYEALKRRAFGGEFKLLKAWADRQAAAEGS